MTLKESVSESAAFALRVIIHIFFFWREILRKGKEKRKERKVCEEQWEGRGCRFEDCTETESLFSYVSEPKLAIFTNSYDHASPRFIA